MQTKTLIITIMVLIMVVLLGWIVYLILGKSGVPIHARFGNEKIVYTLDLSHDKDELIEHCEAFGGTFNECGNPCQPDADFCAAVCALTCEKEAEKVSFRIGDTKDLQGITITIEDVVEDSRCPIDVVCIQAGKVTFAGTLMFGEERRSVNLTNGESYTFGGKVLRIEEVSPAPSSSSPIQKKAYEIVISAK